MKNRGLRLLLPMVMLVMALCMHHPVRAAEPPAQTTANRLLLNGELVATEISKVTGCAISPILGISVLGAYTYFSTPPEERTGLPWHASPRFWTPLLVVLLGIIVKDSAKVALPKIVMIPLDAAETLLEKNTSAALALVVLLTSLTGRGLDQLRLAGSSLIANIPSAAHAAPTAPPVSPSLAGVLELGAVMVGIAIVFTVVWIVSQSFNILMFLCPFSSIDLLLNLGKQGLIALLLCAFLLHPFAGLLVSLPVILISLVLFSWSFRFVLFGTLLSVDLLRGKASQQVDIHTVQAFACRDLPNVPAMNYGRLERRADHLVFTYKPWLFLRSRSITLPDSRAAYRLGKARLSPLLIREQNIDGNYTAMCRLRPRYNSREQAIAEKLGLNGVRDLTLGKTLRDGFAWLKEQFAR